LLRGWRRLDPCKPLGAVVESCGRESPRLHVPAASPSIIWPLRGGSHGAQEGPPRGGLAVGVRRLRVPGRESVHLQPRRSRQVPPPRAQSHPQRLWGGGRAPGRFPGRGIRGLCVAPTALRRGVGGVEPGGSGGRAIGGEGGRCGAAAGVCVCLRPHGPRCPGNDAGLRRGGRCRSRLAFDDLLRHRGASRWRRWRS